MDPLSRKLPKQCPDSIEDWLAKEGYIRKATPNDSTCLFRVVSEEIYLTQHHHILVRKECVDFIRQHPEIIEKNISISVEDYLEQMACFTQWGTENEIKAMSLLYKVDFVVFNGQTLTKHAVTNHGFGKRINLCFTPPKLYDALYTQEQMIDAGFCQSLMYGILYEKIYEMTDIDKTINRMLHEKPHEFRHNKFFQKANMDIRDQLKMELLNQLDDGCDEKKCDENRADFTPAPFPYRVAKALDPYTYRNTDLDVWLEIKKEVRGVGYSRYNNEFQIGAKCLVQLDVKEIMKDKKENGNSNQGSDLKDSSGDSKLSKNLKKDEIVLYNGHIQEMSKNEGPVVVYIEELGERKTVPYSALKPLNIRKSKQNLNWNNNMPKKNMNIDQTQKWKKNWNCARKIKDHAPMTNILHFDRNNDGNRKEEIDPKGWVDINYKNQVSTVVEKYKMQQFNTSNSYVEAPVYNKTVENGQHLVSGNSDLKASDDEHKTLQQKDITKTNTVMQNQQQYTNGKTGNNVYQNVSQLNYEMAQVIPTVQPINLSVKKSIDINGNDLPYSEPCTLRYFYNLGLEYFYSNQMWNYSSNDQMIKPAYFMKQDPPPSNGNGNGPIMPNDMIVNNEGLDQKGDSNFVKGHNMRRKDDNMDRGKNSMQKNSMPRNNERYYKPAKNIQMHGSYEPQKNQRDFNKGMTQNSERKDNPKMNKDVQRNNRNIIGSRLRKYDGRNQYQSQKSEQHVNQVRYNNDATKVNGEISQQCDLEQCSLMQQQQNQSFESGAALYPVPYGQPSIYGQVAVCGETDAYGNFYPSQTNFVPVAYATPPAESVEPCFDGSFGPYPVYAPYSVYPQPPMYGTAGVAENWYPMSAPPPAAPGTYVPYAPIMPSNPPSLNSQNAPA